MTNRFDNGYALLFAVDANAVARWALPEVAKDVAALQEVLIHPYRCAYVGGNQIIHGDNVEGDKVGGDVIHVGSITGSTGIVIGRGDRNELAAGLSGAEIERLFVPLLAAVQAERPETRPAALAQVQALKEEVAKGAKADDKRLARLLDGLVDLAPSAVATVAGLFATPILAGIAGPATQYVLARIQGK